MILDTKHQSTYFVNYFAIKEKQPQFWEATQANHRQCCKQLTFDNYESTPTAFARYRSIQLCILDFFGFLLLYVLNAHSL